MSPTSLTYLHLMLLSLLILFSTSCTRDIHDTPVEFEEISSEYDPKMSPAELEAFKTRAINRLIQKYKTPSQLQRGEIAVTNLADKPCLSVPEKIEPSKLGPKPATEQKSFKKVDQYSQLKIKPEETKGTTHKVPPNAAKQSQPVKVAQYTLPLQGEYALSDPKKPENGVKITAKSGASVVAVEQGKVIFVGSIKGLGKVILIEHTDQIIAAYANVSDIFVRVQQAVTKGQKLAITPSTPSNKVEMHFELRKGTKRLNPLEYLPKP